MTSCTPPVLGWYDSQQISRRIVFCCPDLATPLTSLISKLRVDPGAWAARAHPPPLIASKESTCWLLVLSVPSTDLTFSVRKERDQYHDDFTFFAAKCRKRRHAEFSLVL